MEVEPLRWFLVRATDRVGYLVRMDGERYVLHFNDGTEASYEINEIIQIFVC